MPSIMALSPRDPGDADIDDSVQKWNYACQSLCIITMTLFFGLRVYTRLFILNGFGKEDCEYIFCFIDSSMHGN